MSLLSLQGSGERDLLVLFGRPKPPLQNLPSGYQMITRGFATKLLPRRKECSDDQS